MDSIIGLAIAGGIGALAKDILKDNSIQLPKVEGNKLVLGFIGAVIVGSFVGWAVDGSYLTAGMAGYVGTSAIKDLLPEVNKS